MSVFNNHKSYVLDLIFYFTVENVRTENINLKMF